MKRSHSWFALIGFCIFTGFAVALGFAALLTTASFALADQDGVVVEAAAPAAVQASNASDSDNQTFTGFITDDLCGARHDMGSGKSARECTQACARSGAHYALLDGGKKITLSDNSNQLASIAGQRATITGRMIGNQIQVSAVSSVP